MQEVINQDELTKLGDLGADIRREQDEQLAEFSTAANPELIRARLAQRKQARQRARLQAGAGTLAAAAGLILWLRQSPDTLDFSVDSTTATGSGSGIDSKRVGVVGARLAPTGAPAEEVSFSDGTRFEFAPGSSGRVVSISNHGADLVIDHGSLRAEVVHHKNSHWNLRVGPVDVVVTGTRFNVVTPYALIFPKLSTVRRRLPIPSAFPISSSVAGTPLPPASRFLPRAGAFSGSAAEVGEGSPAPARPTWSRGIACRPSSVT